jgi:hypothetical protein
VNLKGEGKGADRTAVIAGAGAEDGPGRGAAAKVLEKKGGEKAVGGGSRPRRRRKWLRQLQSCRTR